MNKEIETKDVFDRLLKQRFEGDDRAASRADLARLYAITAAQQELLLDLLALGIKCEPKRMGENGAQKLLDKMALLSEDLRQALQALNLDAGKGAAKD